MANKVGKAKVGIAIDAWKFDIFNKALTDAGFTFVKHPGVTADTLLLSVKTEFPGMLADTIKFANDRAAYEKEKRGK